MVLITRKLQPFGFCDKAAIAITLSASQNPFGLETVPAVQRFLIPCLPRLATSLLTFALSWDLEATDPYHDIFWGVYIPPHPRFPKKLLSFDA